MMKFILLGIAVLTYTNSIAQTNDFQIKSLQSVSPKCYYSCETKESDSLNSKRKGKSEPNWIEIICNDDVTNQMLIPVAQKLDLLGFYKYDPQNFEKLKEQYIKGELGAAIVAYAKSNLDKLPITNNLTRELFKSLKLKYPKYTPKSSLVIKY